MAKKKPLFRDVVKEAVKARGLSSGVLARDIGVNESTLRNWLKRNRFPIEVQNKIRAHLGITQDPFSCLVGTARPAAPVASGLKLTKQELEFLVIMHGQCGDLSLATITKLVILMRKEQQPKP